MIEICMIEHNKDKNERKRTVLRKLQETILGGSMTNKRIIRLKCQRKHVFHVAKVSKKKLMNEKPTKYVKTG